MKELIDKYTQHLTQKISIMENGKLTTNVKLRQERKNLKNKIIDSAENILKEIYKACILYNIEFPYGGCYQNDSGYFNSIKMDFKEQEFIFDYEADWAYGGHCENVMYVPFKDIINFTKKKYKAKAKQKAIREIRSEVSMYKEMIIDCEKKILKIKNIK